MAFEARVETLMLKLVVISWNMVPPLLSMDSSAVLPPMEC